jgi:hypothetical protein
MDPYSKDITLLFLHIRCMIKRKKYPEQDSRIPNAPAVRKEGIPDQRGPKKRGGKNYG